MTPLDLDAIERRAVAADEHPRNSGLRLVPDIRALVARVRELEQALAACDEETRLR